jgi:nicotinate-nucleotide pyrophosphorylase (carboxylating)
VSPGTVGTGPLQIVRRTLAAMFVFHPLSEPTRRSLIDGGLDPDAVAGLVRAAVTEDLLGGVDVTSVATIPEDHRSTATFGARQPGVIAGLPVVAAVIDAVCGDAASEFRAMVPDGAQVEAGTKVAEVTAPTRLLLTAERTALNLLCHLSGVATSTRRWADALDGTSAVVRDTRKTTPGLRALEKYAVRCGGGSNHRMGLSDMALVKDNHVAAAGGVTEAYRRVRELASTIPVEIEVDSLGGLREAIDAGADEVLIDNFTPDEMRAAVRLRDELNPAVRIEASGGLTIESARTVAETGVDYIAVGELTHSARVLDIGLDLRTI